MSIDVTTESNTLPHTFLSTWYVGDAIPFFRWTARSAEHLFQALKARNATGFQKIIEMGEPGEAKAAARHMLDLRGDWDRVKFDAMRLVTGLKFTRERDEGLWLIGTGTALLQADAASYGDVWGGSRNWLGVLLMARRAELLAAQTGAPDTDYSQLFAVVRYNGASVDR